MRINPRVSIAVTQQLGPSGRKPTVTNMLTRYRQTIHTEQHVRFGDGFNPRIDARCVHAVLMSMHPFLFIEVGNGERKFAERMLRGIKFGPTYRDRADKG